jgi:hypothetical protein
MSDIVRQHFDENIFYKILDLDQTDKDKVFEMLTKYVDVLKVILDIGNHPILDYISGTPNAELDAIVQNGGDISGVDYDKPRELISQYDAWKAKQPK